LGEAFEGFTIVGSDGSFALVDVKAVVVPGQELVISAPLYFFGADTVGSSSLKPLKKDEFRLE
jgi:hypothetical protein